MSAMESADLDARETALYHPLSSREVRLLLIQPAPFDDPLVCDLTVCSLDKKPIYDALSYTWGCEEDPQSIILNGAVNGVTANLGNALRHLRQKEEDMTLWVDALCIDQTSNDEKSIQVGMMGDIYRRAACVRAWIGMRDDMDLYMEELSGIAERILKGSWYNASGIQSLEIYTTMIRRPYWRRVWIQQELINAANVIIHCGDKVTPFEWWINACQSRFYFIFSNSSLSSSLFSELVTGSNMVNSFGAIRQTAKRISTDESHLILLENQLHRESTDPRDKIYGVLDLVDCWHGGNFVVDYNSSVSRVYTQAVKSIVEHWKRLDFLTDIQIARPELKLSNLPTWCPDWSHFISQIADQQTTFNLNRWQHNGLDYSHLTKCAALILDCGNVLRCQGIVLDRLRDVVDGPFNTPTLSPTVKTIRAIINMTNAGNDAQQKERLWRTLVSNRNWNVNLQSDGFVPAPVEFEAEFENWMKCCEEPPSSSLRPHWDRPWSHNNSNVALSSDAWDMNSSATSFNMSSLIASNCRCFVMTEKGYMGLSPLHAQAGDIAVVLFGCKLPVILRPVDEHYEFIGPAFVLGFERGEAIDLVKNGELKETWFDIH